MEFKGRSYKAKYKNTDKCITKKKTKEKNCLINLFTYQKLENLNSRFIKLRIQCLITMHEQPQSLTASNC